MTRTLAALALTNPELTLLKSVLGLAAARGIRYQLSEDPQAASALIVNTESRAAVERWKEVTAKAAPRVVPCVAIGATGNGPGLVAAATIARPLRAQALLTALGWLEAPLMPGKRVRPAHSAGVIQAGHAAVATERRGAAAADLPQLAGRALIVDDSPVARQHLEDVLGRFGVMAVSAETGERALALLAAHHFDIVFLDVVLPGVDGFEVSRAITHGRRIATPVIMLTSKSSAFDKVRGVLAGCAGYLTKPVALERLRGTLVQHLKPAAAQAPRLRQSALPPGPARGARAPVRAGSVSRPDDA